MDIYLSSSQLAWYGNIAVFLWVLGFIIADSQKSKDEVGRNIGSILFILIFAYSYTEVLYLYISFFIVPDSYIQLSTAVFFTFITTAYAVVIDTKNNFKLSILTALENIPKASESEEDMPTKRLHQIIVTANLLPIVITYYVNLVILYNIYILIIQLFV
tara:strand:+ start:122 stop:598 length:477 start_codon:yes stop_codon:yes gene_type:complete